MAEEIKDNSADKNRLVIETIANTIRDTFDEEKKKLKYDQTFPNVKIKEVLEDDNYKVWFEGSDRILKCENAGFIVGDLVNVVVPRNDWSKMYIDFKKKVEGDDWTPPKEWLKLPPAKEGEITLLVNDVAKLNIYVSDGTGTYRIDYGDGTVIEMPVGEGAYNYIYTTEGHVISNGTNQYIVTISGLTEGLGIRVYNETYSTVDKSSSILLASVNTDVSNSAYLLNGSKTICQIDFLNGEIIPSFAFTGCESLKIVNFPDTLVSLGAQYNLTCIRKLDLSKTKIIDIPQSCFSNFYSLISIKFPNTLKTIGDDAIVNARSLFYVEVPNTLVSIGTTAFSSCYSLTYINVPENCIIGTNAFASCYSLHFPD